MNVKGKNMGKLRQLMAKKNDSRKHTVIAWWSYSVEMVLLGIYPSFTLQEGIAMS